ncbi:hypothetical protein DL546_000467 [Coniochaeta pulveracea]|uniref:Ecp2 effector protein-like domain-containing protein n=1 Tax=Coniochaeta pulveracea TaxID=177199 RepID=A0A420XVQ6_9PEZI|nr:hypothetical protein DL546_000467 [Coniochaeta pulveracea]
MQLPLTLVSLSFLSLSVLAAPISDPLTSPNLTTRAPEDIGAFLDATHNKCGDSVFYDGVGDGITPALISDCLVICKNILPFGIWHLEAMTPTIHQIVQYGTCGFSVQIARFSNALEYHVGNFDICDLIHSSIEKYGNKRDGTVSASGLYKQGGKKLPQINMGKDDS